MLYSSGEMLTVGGREGGSQGRRGVGVKEHCLYYIRISFEERLMNNGVLCCLLSVVVYLTPLLSLCF